ncbi:MAG: hypothetical protein JRN59_02750 [Nitrososphaerota archaeon]|nr:hypothetical protein [Nitrososphaerota archaeon]
MSQKLVYLLLEELGGTATSDQIAALALSKYPDRTLHKYVTIRLNALKNWEIVRRNRDGSWTILRKFE